MLAYRTFGLDGEIASSIRPVAAFEANERTQGPEMGFHVFPPSVERYTPLGALSGESLKKLTPTRWSPIAAYRLLKSVGSTSKPVACPFKVRTQVLPPSIDLKTPNTG